MRTERQLEPTPGWCERARKYVAMIAMEEAAELVAEYEAAKQPAPLGHEFTDEVYGEHHRCKHCQMLVHAIRKTWPCAARCDILNCRATPRKGDFSLPVCRDCGGSMVPFDPNSPCPARNAKPDPEPEKARGLPLALHIELDQCVFSPDQCGGLRRMFAEVLAESRRIAEEVSLRDTNDVRGSINREVGTLRREMRESAREEIAAARIMPGDR